MAVLTGRDHYLKETDPGSLSFRVGFCSYYLEKIHPDVVRALEPAIDIICKKAVFSTDLEIEILPDALDASDIISRAEAVYQHDTNLRRQPENYGPKVRTRLEGGYSVTGLDYLRAIDTQKETIKAFRKVFSSVDVLVAPTIPIPAPRLNTQSIKWPEDQSESIVQCMVRLNAPQNVAGIPCLSIPCGFSSDGLPAGLQLIAWKNQEKLLLDIGRFFQSQTDWHLRRPA